MNAYLDGRYTAEAITNQREAAALHEKATALLLEAIRAHTAVDRKLLRGLLRPEEAEAQREVIKARIAAALAIRKEAVALKYAWIDRYHGQRED